MFLAIIQVLTSLLIGVPTSTVALNPASGMMPPAHPVVDWSPVAAAAKACGSNSCTTGVCMEGNHAINISGEFNTDDEIHTCEPSGTPPWGHNCSSHECLNEDDAEFLAKSGARLEDLRALSAELSESIHVNHAREVVQVVACDGHVIAQIRAEPAVFRAFAAETVLSSD